MRSFPEITAKHPPNTATMEEIILTKLTLKEMRLRCREALQALLAKLPTRHEVPQEDLLTTRGASSLLNLAKPTRYGLVAQQAIPCMKRGRRLYFSKKERMQWVAQGRKSTQEELAAQAQAYLQERAQRKKD